MTSDLFSNDDLKRSANWVIAMSIALIVLGLVAILSPVIATAFFTAMMGWIALISGLVMIVQSFRADSVRGRWLNVIIGGFYAIAGLYILFNLVAAVATLTLAFGILFIAEGIVTIVMGVTQKVGRSLSWLVVLNGLVTLILGILVLRNWPSSALWLIGLYVGISLLFSGISLLSAALAARSALRPSA